ncbi:hypothetical protein Tco_0370744 [Tanacetum coccineum]
MQSMGLTLTLSPITPLDVQFDTPSPLPPIVGHPIPWNLLEAHGDSCLSREVVKKLVEVMEEVVELKFEVVNKCTIQEVKALDAILEDKAQEHCMISFQLLHSHLKLLSNNDLKGTRTEYGFKRAFVTLFDQDLETFTCTMFLNMDQLEKQLDNEEFQEIGSMATFKIPKFRDTLIQHMESVKKLIDERSQHKRESDSWVNERQIQKTNEKVDTSKALDANIIPIYDEEPMDEVQPTAEINVFATGHQHTEQLEFNNEGEVDQNAEQLKSNEAKITHDIDVIETINIELEHKLAKLLKENEILKKHYKELYDSIKTTRARNIEPTILGKLVLQLHRNQSVVRQPTTFESERPRISKPRFASQVDVNNDLSKPVTTHYLHKGKESACAKPHHMIAPGSSRYSSNDMVHNHYLEEAKKKTQESDRNLRPNVMPPAKSQSITNDSKPKPRINNHIRTL